MMPHLDAITSRTIHLRVIFDNDCRTSLVTAPPPTSVDYLNFVDHIEAAYIRITRVTASKPHFQDIIRQLFCSYLVKIGILLCLIFLSSFRRSAMVAVGSIFSAMLQRIVLVVAALKVQDHQLHQETMHDGMS